MFTIRLSYYKRKKKVPFFMKHHVYPAALWVAGICNFPTESCRFPAQEITNDHNFNFVPKFS